MKKIKLSYKFLFFLGIGLLLFKQLIIKPIIGLGVVAGAIEILSWVVLGIALVNFIVEKRRNKAVKN
jgi:multisubunit Na+/H+ antiporter MnhC subunit